MLKAKATLFLIVFVVVFTVNPIMAEKYTIDVVGGHASINFKIKHLGYSWLTGRFDKFAGSFDYDEKNPENSKASLTVKTRSLNTAHALRDGHLRGSKYLNVKKYPEAKFRTISYKPINKTSGVLTGNLSLHGVTRQVSMTIKEVGAGNDPWGGYRRGYETTFKIKLRDYGINHKLGKASEVLELNIFLEGIKNESDNYSLDKNFKN